MGKERFGNNSHPIRIQYEKLKQQSGIFSPAEVVKTTFTVVPEIMLSCQKIFRKAVIITGYQSQDY